MTRSSRLATSTSSVLDATCRSACAAFGARIRRCVGLPVSASMSTRHLRTRWIRCGAAITPPARLRPHRGGVECELGHAASFRRWLRQKPARRRRGNRDWQRRRAPCARWPTGRRARTSRARPSGPLVAAGLEGLGALGFGGPQREDALLGSDARCGRALLGALGLDVRTSDIARAGEKAMFPMLSRQTQRRSCASSALSVTKRLAS